jgi:hypothetical protein
MDPYVRPVQPLATAQIDGVARVAHRSPDMLLATGIAE